MENKWKKEQEAQKAQDYKECIIGMMEEIENLGVLEYLCRFIELYLEKWG